MNNKGNRKKESKRKQIKRLQKEIEETLKKTNMLYDLMIENEIHKHKNPTRR